MRAIYCAGKQGRVVLDILRSTYDPENVVFIDDNADLYGESVKGHKIVGNMDELTAFEDPIEYIVALGNQPSVRLKIADRLTDAGCEFFNALHASSTVSNQASLGRGVMLNAESYLGPGVEVGDHVLIDSCVNISHDVRLSQGATVTPGVTVAGGAILERNSYVGPGATVLKNLTIGEDVIVGAGAVVTEDVSPNTTVVGVPASPLENKS